MKEIQTLTKTSKMLRDYCLRSTSVNNPATVFSYILRNKLRLFCMAIDQTYRLDDPL